MVWGHLFLQYRIQFGNESQQKQSRLHYKVHHIIWEEQLSQMNILYVESPSVLGVHG